MARSRGRASIAGIGIGSGTLRGWRRGIIVWIRRGRQRRLGMCRWALRGRKGRVQREGASRIVRRGTGVGVRSSNYGKPSCAHRAEPSQDCPDISTSDCSLSINQRPRTSLVACGRLHPSSQFLCIENLISACCTSCCFWALLVSSVHVLESDTPLSFLATVRLGLVLPAWRFGDSRAMELYCVMSIPAFAIT